MASAVMVTIVLILNGALLIFATAYSDLRATGGSGILLEGSCSAVNRLNQLLHLCINALSTILLSASNYTQQCLVAPGRQDIDAAHKEQKWLDMTSASPVCEICGECDGGGPSPGCA